MNYRNNSVACVGGPDQCDFKIGDVVRLVNNSNLLNLNVDLIAVVVGLNLNLQTIGVRFADSTDTYWLRADRFVLATEGG